MNENAPLAAQAKPNAKRNVEGRLVIGEGNRVAWQMCYHSAWWRSRMAETAIELIKRENAGGIYFDTFPGGCFECFHTGHGHSHAGGNDPYLGACQLSRAVRGAIKGVNPESVISGENPAETAKELRETLRKLTGR